MPYFPFLFAREGKGVAKQGLTANLIFKNKFKLQYAFKTQLAALGRKKMYLIYSPGFLLFFPGRAISILEAQG